MSFPCIIFNFLSSFHSCKASFMLQDGIGFLILVYNEVLDLVESSQIRRQSKLKFPKILRGKKLVTQILKI